MLGKQIYKGCLDRTVLGETPRGNGNGNGDSGSGANPSRLWNKDELSKVFELAPEGTCETIDRLKESKDYKKGDWIHKCSIKESHKSVVGISRRCDVYNATTSRKKGPMEEEDTAAEEGGNKKQKISTDSSTTAEMSVTADGSTLHESGEQPTSEAMALEQPEPSFLDKEVEATMTEEPGPLPPIKEEVMEFEAASSATATNQMTDSSIELASTAEGKKGADEEAASSVAEPACESSETLLKEVPCIKKEPIE